jgi:hypothetical protein
MRLKNIPLLLSVMLLALSIGCQSEHSQLPLKTRMRMALGLEGDLRTPREKKVDALKEKIISTRQDVQEVYASLGLDIQFPPLPEKLDHLLATYKKNVVAPAAETVVAALPPPFDPTPPDPVAPPPPVPTPKPIESTEPTTEPVALAKPATPPEPNVPDVPPAKPTDPTEPTTEPLALAKPVTPPEPNAPVVPPVQPIEPTEPKTEPDPIEPQEPKTEPKPQPDIPEIEFAFIDLEKLQQTGIAYARSGKTGVPLTAKAVRNYRNGIKSLEITYIKGLSNGMLTRWHPNGKKLLEINLVDNVPDGLSTEWYANGQKFRTVPYLAGKIHGQVKIWDSDGELLSTQQYERGKLLNDE